MSRMFNILVLYPEHLNLNGDVANAGVLARRMNWYGLSAAIDFHHPGEALPMHIPDFILIGHGSEAAWNAIRDDLNSNWSTIRGWIAAGAFGLTVNSGQELLHELEYSVFPPGLKQGERVSKFVVAEADVIEPGQRVLGYQNSEFDAPIIERFQNLVGTQLHGPILAKNAWMADWFISKISGEAQLEPTQSAQTHTALVAELEAAIWKLEAQLANE